MNTKCISVCDQTIDCAICIAPVLLGTKTPCGHVFHNRCIKRWLGTTLLKYKDSGTCPLCRNEISHTAIIDIQTITQKHIHTQMLNSVKNYM